MSPSRRSFQRPRGERRYRRIFLIAAEGTKTEPQYFGMFNGQESVIWVKCIKDSDEAWLVVDKDRWTDQDLAQLHEWSRSSTNFGLAVSNPKFEYWLLLHFENGSGVASAHDCSERLEKHIPDYDKGIDARKIGQEMVNDAIKRAKAGDTPPVSIGRTA